MNKLGAERLWKLSQFLYTVPPGRFSLESWITGNINDCETTACAMGWAVTIFEELDFTNSCSDPICYNGVKMNAYTIAREFFNIGHNTSRYFLKAESYEETDIPQLVAQRIENYVLKQYPEFKSSLQAASNRTINSV